MTSLAEHLQATARNNAWANFRLLQACAQLTEEAYRARRTSFFPSIHLTLNHVLVVDRYYLDVLDNGGRRWREIYAQGDAPCPTFADVRREQTAADRRLIAYCDQLTPARLDDVVTLYRPGDLQYRERIQDVLTHLFQHDIHHRGQVHAMLAGTDVAPPSSTSSSSSRTRLCAPTTCARWGCRSAERRNHAAARAAAIRGAVSRALVDTSDLDLAGAYCGCCLSRTVAAWREQLTLGAADLRGSSSRRG